MSTGIEWTDETWNPVTGCTKVSPGCDHCYAERITNRFGGPGAFDTVVLHPDRLKQPSHWRKPRRVFVNSMSDLFHGKVPITFIARVFNVMGSNPQHTFQILTKRPGPMAAFARGYYDIISAEPFPNVWLGTSVESQHWADVRIPKLLETPAAVRFLSCEPLLGPVDIWSYVHAIEMPSVTRKYEGAFDITMVDRRDVGIDWVIVGGESGPGARPMHPDWARSLRDQCVAASVPFFFKQWGEYLHRDALTDDQGQRIDAAVNLAGNPQEWFRLGKHKAGRELDGELWNQFPDFITTSSG